MIDKSMKVSQSAEQLSPVKEEQKAKTVVVNVELDGNRADPTIKDRIAALQAIVSKQHVPIAKVDSVDDDVRILSRTEELQHMALEAKPSPQAVIINIAQESIFILNFQLGALRRRHVRFMRGCCVVQ